MSRRERANRQRNHALENTFALGTEGGDARAVLGLVRALAADALLARAKSFGWGRVFSPRGNAARDARGRKIRNNTRAGAEVRCKKLVLFL